MPGSDERLLDVWRESGRLARPDTYSRGHVDSGKLWVASPLAGGNSRWQRSRSRMGDNRFWLRDGCWERPPAHLGRPGAVNTGAAGS